jgi:hypothetical protein
MGADLKIFNLKNNQCHPFFFKKKNLFSSLYILMMGSQISPPHLKIFFWVVFNIVVEVVF